MKKLLIYFLILQFTQQASTQNTGFYTGLNGALQNTWILNSDDFDQSGALEFAVTFKPAFGLDIGYSFKPNMALQTGIIYSEQGQNYETNGNTNANYETDLTYLKFPVLFCYHIKPENKLSLIAQGGLQLSLLSEAKSSRENVFGIYSPLYKDVKEYYSSSTIDAVLVFGLQYNLGKLNIQLLVKADYSLSDIEEAEKKVGLRNPSSNFTLAIPQLGFHYYFK